MPSSVASSTLTSSIVSALEAYKSAAGVSLNIYRGRPKTISPPHAWIDTRHDDISSIMAGSAMDHTATVEVVVVHGEFDTAEAVNQRDAWVDGFNSYLRDSLRGEGLAGGNSVLEKWTVDDTPDYTPTWTVTERAYYATIYRLEVSIAD